MGMPTEHSLKTLDFLAIIVKGIERSSSPYESIGLLRRDPQFVPKPSTPFTSARVESGSAWGLSERPDLCAQPGRGGRERGDSDVSATPGGPVSRAH